MLGNDDDGKPIIVEKYSGRVLTLPDCSDIMIQKVVKMTVQDRINQLTTPMSRKLLQNFHDAIMEAITVPNGYLPEDYQNHKEYDPDDNGNQVYGATLAQIEKKYNATRKASIERLEHAKERSRRVERMAAEFANNGKFEYDEFVVDAISAGRPNDIF